MVCLTYAYITRLAPQPGTAARLAGLVPAIPAEEHAHVDFVFLLLEEPEEPRDALESSVALDHEAPIGLGQGVPGRVKRTGLGSLATRLSSAQRRSVVRLGPRFDGPAVEGLRRIRHDEVHVQFDHVAEAMAGRARAERVVEREQPGLRDLVRHAARRGTRIAH